MSEEANINLAELAGGNCISYDWKEPGYSRKGKTQRLSWKRLVWNYLNISVSSSSSVATTKLPRRTLWWSKGKPSTSFVLPPNPVSFHTPDNRYVLFSWWRDHIETKHITPSGLLPVCEARITSCLSYRHRIAIILQLLESVRRPTSGMM
jgi:hypothetical protein